MASPVISELDNADVPSRSRIIAALLFVGGLVSLWLLRSSLVAVYGHLGDWPRSTGVGWSAVFGCEAAAFVASWELGRVALRTDRWFDVAVAQLTGNAASNVVPAGGPVGAAVQLRVLSEAGFDLTRAATSMGALSLLGAVGLLALPGHRPSVRAGCRVERTWARRILWVGVALLVALLVVAAVRPRGATRHWSDWRLASRRVRNRVRPRNARLISRHGCWPSATRSAWRSRPTRARRVRHGRQDGARLPALYLPSSPSAPTRRRSWSSAFGCRERGRDDPPHAGRPRFRRGRHHGHVGRVGDRSGRTPRSPPPCTDWPTPGCPSLPGSPDTSLFRGRHRHDNKRSIPATAETPRMSPPSPAPRRAIDANHRRGRNAQQRSRLPALIDDAPVAAPAWRRLATVAITADRPSCCCHRYWSGSTATSARRSRSDPAGCCSSRP